MSKVTDIAKFVVNIGIDIKNTTGDEQYLMDFYKLNKLLYLAQGIYLVQENGNLFDEDIYAYPCGPYIKEIEFIFKDWNYEVLTKPYCLEFPIPSLIRNFLTDFVLHYGHYDKQLLGITTKKQAPWKNSICFSTEYPVISNKSIQDYFSSVNSLTEEIKSNKKDFANGK